MIARSACVLLIGALLTGCTDPTVPRDPVRMADGSYRYTDPAQSGLRAVRPWPGPQDVCQVIGENAVTSQYLDDSAILIGCPVHETGAIADRMADGAVPLDQVGVWQLLSQPQR